MSAIETGLYVAVGAADLAAEKVRELPAVKEIVERSSKLRETSLIDQAREIEPKVRKQAKELQARGESVVARIRKDVPRNFREFNDKATKQLKDFPTEARKQFEELPENARKQVAEIRGTIEKRFGRETAKPAAKTSAAKPKATATAPKSS
jgi:heparin binding hemagglutinin HbhA